MSKKNRLTLADLGMIVEDASFSMPEPADALLTNIPPGKGTDEALAVIDGGEAKPGINWSPSMQDQPQDAPKDREAQEMKQDKGGITAKTGASGEQSSDAAADAGKQADDKDKPDFLKKKTEESFKLSAADIGLVLEDDGNPFRDEADDGDAEDVGGQQSGGQQSGGQQAGGQQAGGQQAGGQQAGGQQAGGQQAGGQQSGGQQGGQQSGGQQSEERLMDHNMGAGEIAVDQDLMKDILRAAVADQSDDAKIDLIVQAIAGCCGEDRTLTVADADAIMGKLKELSGGQQGQQGGQMGGQQGGQQAPQMGGQQGQQGGAQMGGQQAPAMDSPEAIDAVPPGDGEVAGPEGGQQHEGKTKLMASIGESTKTKAGKKKMTLAEAWIMGVPGVGVAQCLGETGGDDEIDEDTLELRRMARKAGNPNWMNVGR